MLRSRHGSVIPLEREAGVDTFLTILWIVLAVAGGLVLGVVLLAAIVFLLIRRKLRGFAEKLKELGPVLAGLNVPPFRIDLRPREDFDEWADAEAVEQKVEAFEELGFQKINEFEIDEIFTSMVALHHPETRAVGVVYEQPQLGVWVDIVSDYEDGRQFTASTGQPDLLEKPPGKLFFNAPELRVPELYERFLRERPPEGMLSVPVEGFTAYFEREWTEEMTWRGARRGPTAEEVRAIAERDGNETTPEQIDGVQGAWQSRYAEFFADELREEYLRSGALSAAEWEKVRDRLLFVHEWSPARELAEQIIDAGEEEEEDGDEQVERMTGEFAPHNHRESFQRLNAQLPEGRRLERIGELQEPVPADVYLTRDEW